MHPDGDFPTGTDGLETAASPGIVRLRDRGRLDLRITAVRKPIDGADIRMLAYNGSIPGPTLHVDQGSVVTVRARNEGDIETTVHWHGLRLDNRSDGVPVDTQPPIEIGGEYTCDVQFADPGVYWYHPHLREDFAQEMGLYGAIVVEPSDAGYWPPADRALIITLDDVLIEDGRMAPFHRSGPTHVAMGRFGNVFLINGDTAYTARASVGEVVRLYLVNTANTRIFHVAIPGARMKLVGGDSGRCERETFVEKVLLAPSERAVVDVLFETSGELRLEHQPPGQAHRLGSFVVTDGAPTVAARSFDSLRVDAELSALRGSLDRDMTRAPDKVLAFVASMPLLYGSDQATSSGYVCPMHPEVTSREPAKCPKCGMKLVAASAMGAQPSSGHAAHHDAGHDHHEGGDGIEWEDLMPEINRASDSENMLWKIVDRSSGAENHAINWSFTVGDRVKIRLVNEMESDHPMHHPFHVHGAGRFLILARDGAPESNLVWKDTVLVRAGETVDVLLDVTNPGRWMAHCHIAEHIEAGMMFSFNVSPTSTEAAMQEATQGQVLDPVCGMMIDRADAAETRQFAGDTYFFCSTSCAMKFDADAAAYAAAPRADGFEKRYGEAAPGHGAHAHRSQSETRPS